MSTMDPVTVIIGLFSGALGALAATAVSLHFSARASKQALALDLHREFSSAEFYEGRIAGEKILKESLGKSIDQHHAEMSASDYAKKFAVLGFFERVSVCYTSGTADRVLVHRLFGEKFMFWFYRMKRAGLFSTDWEYAKRWEELKDGLSRNAADYTDWVERASAQK